MEEKEATDEPSWKEQPEYDTTMDEKKVSNTEYFHFAWKIMYSKYFILQVL